MKSLLILVALALPISMAHASDYYYGGGYGQSSEGGVCDAIKEKYQSVYNSKSNIGVCDDKPYGYQFNLTYKAFSPLDFRLAYVTSGNFEGRVGLENANGSFRVEDKIKAYIRGFSLSAVGHIPLSEKFSLNASVGTFKWKGTYSHYRSVSADTGEPKYQAESDSEHQSGNSATYGLNIQWLGEAGTSLVLSWDRYKNITINTGDASIAAPAFNADFTLITLGFQAPY